MLVLTRKKGERVLIGDDIVITLIDVRGDGVRIGFDAPRGVKIQRAEVLRAVQEANAEAAASSDATRDVLVGLLAGARRAAPRADPSAVDPQGAPAPAPSETPAEATTAPKPGPPRPRS